MVGMSLTKMSSPKLQVPQSRVAISGKSSVGWSRSSGVMPVAPPVEGMRITPGQAALMASSTKRNRSRSWVGVPSSQRTCTWMTAAPAS